MKAVVKYISPRGEIFWDAYGPMVKDQSKAEPFINEIVARNAALNRLGRGDEGFWNSERTHFQNAKKQYQGWKFEVIPVSELIEAKLASELVSISKMLMASDPILESVVDAIAGYSFMSLRKPLESLGLGSVTMSTIDMGPSVWMIKMRNGKKIAIVPRSQSDPDANDIVVQDKVVGYL